LKRRLPFLEVRRAAHKAVRAYFQAEGFMDVETPILQVSGGIERHIRAFTTTLTEPFGQATVERALHTSPEFAMKKLLVAGLPKIYQMARVFRNGERSPLHHPEFTMLEWYRAGTSYEAMMDDCAALLAKVAKAAHRALEHDGLLKWQGKVCDPALAPERLTVSEAFQRYANIDLLSTIADHTAAMPNPDMLRAAAAQNGIVSSASDTWEDIFFRVMLDKIEHRLGEGRPTILCEYPACLAALAQRKASDSRVAERFELYACGVELANAFGELTDAAEQRRRFEHDRKMHQELYGEAPALDEDFLAALDAGLPVSSGCALGFDRLVMLASHASDITDVLWAPVA
ncbi:MAG: EF-P lysine aminoacylase GenX, partial [Rhodospirillaceae bacterium]|nr:EF-P lysine aminoacylase GenX [Rhodospirillaceae bacterium]